jgi:hypothetical protein
MGHGRAEQSEALPVEAGRWTARDPRSVTDKIL